MESLSLGVGDGTSSCELLSSSSPSTSNPSRPTRTPSAYEKASSPSSLQVQDQVSCGNNQVQLHSTTNIHSTQQFHKSNKGKSELVVSDESVDVDSVMENKDWVVDDMDNGEVGGFLESENLVSDSCNEDVAELNDKCTSQVGISDDKSPQNSLYDSSSAIDKSVENGEASITSVYRGSTGSDLSDESSSSSLSSTMYKPHKANDARWEAIRVVVRSHDGSLGFNHFRLLSRLGCGDIGSVYLSELSGTKSYFAMKVMDKAALASRKKLLRAQTEREILQCLDHPFLPTLYSHFETEKFSCLVMEFCPGGDLHALRQKQPGKYFPEHAARFYVAEVLLAMEYLHMLGIIYRDLKPENVLVREDGHIMLSDFDLSLRCAVNPTLVKSSSSITESSAYCIQPACIQPTCFAPRFFSSKPKKPKQVKKQKSIVCNKMGLLPELMAEPTSARSMSFVGTHEYLAPEIIKGEGHGSAVDWWTFGIFLYELLFGRTPFKGKENRATLFNVVGQTLKFPETPCVSFAARDLIRGLLVKEPQHRLAYRRGATEIKQHAFFQNVNWALIRCASPPDVPKPVSIESPVSSTDAAKTTVADKSSGNYVEMEFF